MVRGCDLWTREYQDAICERAYGGGRVGNAFDAYRRARWEMWAEVAEEEKAEWVWRGKPARELLDEEIAKIKLPILSSRYCYSCRN